MQKSLNFGHTFGHALESTSNYNIPHGTAILFGILISNNISTKLGHLDITKNLNLQNLIYDFIKQQYLEKEWFNFDNLIKVIELDKKNTPGSINMVLLTNSKYIISKIDNLEILKQAIHEVIRLCDTVS